MAETNTIAPIPAATVVLLRDGKSGVEVLMLRKNAKIDFGGMWVFPGGRIEEEDYPPDRDIDLAARVAAAREIPPSTGKGKHLPGFRAPFSQAEPQRSLRHGGKFATRRRDFACPISTHFLPVDRFARHCAGVC